MLKTMQLGNTGLTITKTAMAVFRSSAAIRKRRWRFSGRPIGAESAFYDTANAYTDSEEKIGLALSDVRKDIVIATKSHQKTREGVLAHIENSLRMMKTDYIDLFQFHNIPKLLDPKDPEGPYAGALEAKKRGWIRHIGVTTHRVAVAEECIESGLFETLQFPFSYISSDRDIALAEKCKAAGMPLIAMKGLAGGLLTNTRACYAFMNQFDNVVPIWGIQRLSELEEWLKVGEEDVRMDEEIAAFIQKERKEMMSAFCRGCGYCMPCTVGIEINNAARMNMLLRRSPWQQYMTPEWKAKMELIRECVHCDLCKSKCPYELDTPALLQTMLEDYEEFYRTHAGSEQERSQGEIIN